MRMLLIALATVVVPAEAARAQLGSQVFAPPGATATNVLSEAEQQRPWLAAGRLVREADADYSAGRAFDALNGYREALNLLPRKDPARIDIRLRMGLAYAQLGLCEWAFDALDRVVTKLGTDPEREPGRRESARRIQSACGL